MHGVFISAFEAQIGRLGVALNQPPTLEMPTNASSDGMGKGGELGTCRGLHPAKAQRSVGAFDVDAVEHHHMEMDVEIDCTPKHWISVTAPVCAELVL